MPKTKRGRRQHHYKVKNGERLWQKRKQLHDVTNLTTPRLEMETVSSFFEQMQSSDALSGFSKWHFYKTTDIVELSMVHNSPPNPSIVKLSLTIFSNLKWTVKVYGQPVAVNNSILCVCPVLINSFDDLRSVCKILSEANLCQGNNETNFIQLLESRGGTIKNVSKSVVAYIDAAANTVRHQSCSLLCNESKCQSCHQYRPSLRAMLSKSSKQSSQSKTDSSSHANYRYLQPQELTTRLKNVQRAKRIAERSVARLKEKLSGIIDREGVDLSEDDSCELEELFMEADKEVSKKLSREHFQRTFWEQQRSYNKLSSKRRMRWHPLMIRFALNLRYLSSTAYQALQHFIALPFQRTLCDYTHVMTIQSGVSNEMIKRLKNDMKFDECSPSMKKVGILLDEMKIKSGLVFNKKLGKLVGFVDLGTINNDLEALESSLTSTATSVQPQLADSMLVLMIRSLMKPSLVVPIAQYSTSSLSGAKLYPIVWDTIEALELNEVQVFFVTCDGLSANRKFFQIAKDIDKSLKFPFKTSNPYSLDRQIYYFCDVPHLIKTTRNCFSNSYAHTHSRMLKVMCYSGTCLYSAH